VGEGVSEKTNTGDLLNEGEGMNIYTHRMSVGEGEHLPTYLTDRKISVIISLKNVMDSFQYKCYPSSENENLFEKYECVIC